MESWFLGVVHTSCWSLSWDLREDASRRKVRSKVHDAIRGIQRRTKRRYGWSRFQWMLLDRRSSLFRRILARKNYRLASSGRNSNVNG